MDYSAIYTLLSLTLLYTMYSYWRKVKNQKIEEVDISLFCEKCGKQIEEAIENETEKVYSFVCKNCGTKGTHNIEKK